MGNVSTVQTKFPLENQLVVVLKQMTVRKRDSAYLCELHFNVTNKLHSVSIFVRINSFFANGSAVQYLYE